MLADALEALKESREPDPDAVLADGLAQMGADLLGQAQAQTRAAKEIEAAWHDPHWLDGH